MDLADRLELAAKIHDDLAGKGGAMAATIREAASALRSSGEAVEPHCSGHERFDYDCIDCSDALERKRKGNVPGDGTYPATPASAWRPIAEAPRDGSMFLCWVSAIRYGEDDDGRPYESDVSAMDFCEWREMDDGDGFWMPYASPHGDGEVVTHWMQISPPTGAAE